MAIVLNIQAWQNPTSKKIEDAAELPISRITAECEPQQRAIVGKFCPEMRIGYFMNFYNENSPLESQCIKLEKMLAQYSKSTNAMERFLLKLDYAKTAEYYNLLVGFNCMEKDISQLNTTLTNNSGKIVVSL